jgi:FG-GAP-like repeat/Abnormal spindle-like microcephaly-assoc'd, ASPM-SPD-2-Hydin/IPT/TIG domain
MKFVLSFLLFSSIAVAQSPQITTVYPTSITAYGPNTLLKVYGSQFTKTNVVYWNSLPKATTFISTTQLNAEILASDIATPSTALVTVEDPITVTRAYGVSLPVTGGVPALSYTRMVGPWNFAPDREGHPYLTVNYGDGAWSILAGGFLWGNNPDGTIGGGSEEYTIVAVGDLCSIGSIELIGSTKSDCGRLFRPSGPELSTHVVLADIDRDGSLDILDYGSSPRPDETVVQFWRGNGLGLLIQPAIAVVPFPNLDIKYLLLGDFNGDGKLDLAAIVWDYDDPPKTQPLAIALGNGDGTFKPPTFVPVPASTEYVQIGDVNGDGILDLVSEYEPGGAAYTALQVWLGKGDGTFTLHGSYSTGLYAGGNGFTLANMIGGHRQDVVLAGTLDAAGKYPRLEVMPGNPDGSFGAATESTRLVVPSAGELLVGDFNNDGRLDVISSNGWYFVQKPLIWLSNLSLSFGSVFLGSTDTRTLTVTNTGAVPVPIAGIKFTGSGASQFTETDDCGTLAARGGVCTVQVEFVPTVDGPATATMTVEHSVEGTNTVALSGTGI